jgi:hypothetical protein
MTLPSFDEIAHEHAEFIRRQDHLSDAEVITFAEKYLFSDEDRAWFKKRKLRFSQVLVGKYESTAATDKYLDAMFRRWNGQLGIDYFGLGGGI